MTQPMTESPHDWAGSMDIVGLDELDATASLQTRVDRKYLLPATQLALLLPQIHDSARVLEIDGRRDFGYWSTYYDSPDLVCYLAAARRRPRRFKVRARTYLDSDLHFIEVKTRNGRGRTVKTRRMTTGSDHVALSPMSRQFVATTLAEQIPRFGLGEATATVGTLTPTLDTEYSRLTLLIPSDSTRATIDTRLSVSLPDGRAARLDDHVIIETKTSGRRSPIDEALWSLGVRPTKLSKFGTGLALLRPELPAAKWNRVLRSELGWVPDRPVDRLS